MFRKLAGILGGALTVVMIAWLVGPTGAFAAEPATDPPMCDPVTLDDLFPPEETATTPTTTTTTPPAPTTTSGSNNNGASSNPPTTTTTEVVAAPADPIPVVDCEPFLYEMAWPLANEGRFISRFAAPRDRGTRLHKGIDVAAPQLTPVLAVADGRIGQIHGEAGAEDCCWLVVQHDDGWESWYLHLNNDSYETDDGLGAGIRTDLERGTRIKQGEVLGWLGDSGNAEATVAHLHFELRNQEGEAVDAWDSLKTAKKATSFEGILAPGPYVDTLPGEGAGLAARFVTEGLHLACDALGIQHCPDEPASPEFIAAIGAHVAGKETPTVEGTYTSASVLEFTSGTEFTVAEFLECELVEECLDFGVTETELTRLVSWIVRDRLVSSGEAVNPDNPPVVSMTTASSSERTLRRLGVLEGCHTLDPVGILTRAEALERMAWWVLGLEPNPCPPPDQPNR